VIKNRVKSEMCNNGTLLCSECGRAAVYCFSAAGICPLTTVSKATTTTTTQPHSKRINFSCSIVLGLIIRNVHSTVINVVDRSQRTDRGSATVINIRLCLCTAINLLFCVNHICTVHIAAKPQQNTMEPQYNNLI